MRRGKKSRRIDVIIQAWLVTCAVTHQYSLHFAVYDVSVFNSSYSNKKSIDERRK